MGGVEWGGSGLRGRERWPRVLAWGVVCGVRGGRAGGRAGGRVGDTGQGFGGIVVNTGREPADDESSAIAAAAAVAEAAFYNALR
jgi:hypothetical protein